MPAIESVIGSFHHRFVDRGKQPQVGIVGVEPLRIADGMDADRPTNWCTTAALFCEAAG